eukprot:jgi/Galph1/2441/GphlegSOOS_G1114.1
MVKSLDQTLLWARKRYLQGIQALTQKQAVIYLYERTKVKVTIEAVDARTETMVVKDLETPLGVYPHAVLRCSDIIACSTVQQNIL